MEKVILTRSKSHIHVALSTKRIIKGEPALPIIPGGISMLSLACWVIRQVFLLATLTAEIRLWIWDLDDTAPKKVKYNCEGYQHGWRIRHLEEAMVCVILCKGQPENMQT